VFGLAYDRRDKPLAEFNRDYYQILGVAKNASDGDIKKAYRRLAVEYHPDRNQGSKEAEEKFKEVAEAYSVLSDPDKRAIYDRYGADGLKGAGFSPGFQSVEDIFQSFGSIFGDLFGFGSFGGRQRRRSGPQRGSDLRYDIEIPLKEAVLGAEREIALDIPTQCDECHGSGAAAGTSRTTCPRCHGSGAIMQNQGFFTLTTTCPNCRGAGSVIEKPCPRCHGAGKVEKRRTVTLSIPPGVDDGTRMRLSGEGDAGSLGGSPGDLYVVLHVMPDEHFVRDGQHLHVEYEIDFTQAILGASIEIEVLDGSKVIEVPAGTQPGDELVIRGAGVPHLRGHGRGNVIVHLKVVLPKKLTEQQEELLREYAAHAKNDVNKKRKGIFQRRN
jgi:molecular chaperone DnaJ